MRVLTADDDPDIRALHALALAGHQATLAQDGVDAGRLWEMAASGAIDAVLIDGHVPVVDGLSAIRHILQLPHGQGLPIWMLTAYDYSSEALEQAGVTGVVRKPILPMDPLARLLAMV